MMRLSTLTILLVALVGCAATHASRNWASNTRVPTRVEIEGVPFVAQAEYQCGPASLAMVLAWIGHPASPGELAGQVYSFTRRGSLPTDMIGAPRRRGLAAYPISTLRDLVAEVAAANPVVVLQDVGIPGHPQWHYAVVVGYDLGRDEIILRSGHTRRAVSSLARFQRTWAASNHWGFVVLPPRTLPATADEQTVLDAIVGLERARQWAAAVEAYTSVHERWPRSLGGLIGLGNSRYAQGDLAGAEKAFRLAARTHPDAAVAFNNLAHVRLESRRYEDARTAARRAAELSDASESADASCDVCVATPRPCRTRCEMPNGLEGRQR